MRLAIGTRPARRPDGRVRRGVHLRRGASAWSTTTRSTCWCSTARRPRPAASASPARSRTRSTTRPPTCVVIARAADRWLAAYAQVDATLVHPLDPVTTGQTIADAAAATRVPPAPDPSYRAATPLAPLGRPAMGERTWPHLLSALLRGEELSTAGHRLGDGRDHGRRGHAGADRRLRRRAAGQGRDRRPSWPAWSRRCSAHAVPVDAARRAARSRRRRRRRHRRRPGPHGQHLDDGGASWSPAPGSGWSSTATGPPPRSCGTADLLEHLGIPLDLGPERGGPLRRRGRHRLLLRGPLPPRHAARRPVPGASWACPPRSTSSAR